MTTLYNRKYHGSLLSNCSPLDGWALHKVGRDYKEDTQEYTGESVLNWKAVVNYPSGSWSSGEPLSLVYVDNSSMAANFYLFVLNMLFLMWWIWSGLFREEAQHCKKAIRHLEMWSEISESVLELIDKWYMINLRENSKETPAVPWIGQVALNKGNLPRGQWKMGKIPELLFRRSGQLECLFHHKCICTDYWICYISLSAPCTDIATEVGIKKGYKTPFRRFSHKCYY